MKINCSAFQDFLPHTFFGSKKLLSILTSEKSIIIIFTFIADRICINLKITFQNALLNNSTCCHVVLNQQLPSTFYNPHKSKLDLDYSQTLKKALVSLYLSLTFCIFLQMSSNFQIF